MAGMPMRRFATLPCKALLDGCAALLWRDDIDGYRELPFRRRFVLDCRALCRAFATRGFWRTVFLFAVAAALAQVWIWRHDLRGPARDAVYLLPSVLIAPLAARGRRRHLVRLIGEKHSR
jgi:hypothetical protein